MQHTNQTVNIHIHFLKAFQETAYHSIKAPFKLGIICDYNQIKLSSDQNTASLHLSLLYLDYLLNLFFKLSLEQIALMQSKHSCQPIIQRQKKCFAWMAQLKQLIPVCPRLPQKYGKQIIVMTNTNLSFVCFCSSIVKSIALQYKGHGFNPKGTHQRTNKKIFRLNAL